ncbi:MAG TPA: ROK family protein, partial [Candidatus Nanoarchaeia archaeon]|nr:ROK family protein [Candidatus Nanoarchaeia archaeon]
MDREFLIGVEVNSKTITAGLVDLGGKIVKRVILPTELSKGKAKTVENIALAINRVKKNKILGVGVSLPGIINREKGIVVESPFPGWNGIMLKKSIEDAVKIPVFIENEGRCFAIAEYKCGIFKKTDNSISVLFNDRISAGIMIDGKLAKGAFFAAGLVSHSVV